MMAYLNSSHTPAFVHGFQLTCLIMFFDMSLPHKIHFIDESFVDPFVEQNDINSLK